MLRTKQHTISINPIDHYLIAMTGKAIQLSPIKTYTIGRADDADIRVADTLTSRQHAELSWTTGEGWILTDNNSRHGTRVDGTKIAVPTALTDYCQIQIGGWQFTYRRSPTGTKPQLQEQSVADIPTFDNDHSESLDPDLSGRCTTTPLSVLLAYMADTASTGTIIFDRHTESRTITLHDGTSTHAQYGEWEGEEALLKAAREARSFAFYRHQVDPSHRGYNIHKTIEEIYPTLVAQEGQEED